jgi:hypothetical protein
MERFVNGCQSLWAGGSDGAGGAVWRKTTSPLPNINTRRAVHERNNRMEPTADSLRSLWIVIISLVAAFVAATTGVLAWLAGAHPAAAAITAGGAYATATVLLLALLRFAHGEI